MVTDFDLLTSEGSLADTKSSGALYLKRQFLCAHILATLWNIENDDKLDIMKIEMEFHNKAHGIAEGALHKNHVFYPHFREIG